MNHMVKYALAKTLGLLTAGGAGGYYMGREKGLSELLSSEEVLQKAIEKLGPLSDEDKTEKMLRYFGTMPGNNWLGQTPASKHMGLNREGITEADILNHLIQKYK